MIIRSTNPLSTKSTSLFNFGRLQSIWAAALVALVTSFGLFPSEGAMDQTNTTPNSVYVRPGGTSYSWRFSSGTMPGYSGSYPVTAVRYYNVPGFNWYVTRGHFEYSADDGVSWNTYTLSDSSAFISNPANLWRFVDTSPANTTSLNQYGTAWTLQGPPGSASSGGYVYPDNAPTNIMIDRTYVLSTVSAGSKAAVLKPGDTGDTRHGFWEIESQSIPNLFTLSFNPNTGNSANLLIGAGSLPAIGDSATVTVRYYDLYQTDTAGVPIPGQGVSQQFTMTVIPGTTRDLSFGDDLFVNTYTNDDQSHAAMEKLSDGNFVVVWESAGQNKSSTSYYSIHGQKFSSTGSKIGSEFLIGNSGSSISESVPDVAPLNDGRFVVTYQTSGADSDVAFRIVEADGTIGAQKIANTTTADNQGNPRIATLTDGSFVIVWAADTYDIKLQQFSAVNGTAIGGEVSIADASGYSPDVTALSNGSYAVVWADGNTYEIMAKVGSSGSDLDTGISWSGYAPPAIAGLAGGFVVVSEAWDYDTSHSKIEAIRYNNSGVAQGGIFPVNTKSGGERFGASVAALSGGGFVAAWTTDSDDRDLEGISGRRFNADGSAVDSVEFQVNEYRADDQSLSALCALDNNLFAAAWTDVPGTSIDDGTYIGNVEARVLLPANVAPTFVGSTTILNAGENTTNDITSLLHVSDTDNGQTLTWSEQTAPSHGTLEFSGATASTGGADISPSGSISYVPDSNYVGADSFAIQVSDGIDTATRTLSVTIADTTPPRITSVSVPADKTYVAEQDLDFTVNFDEAVIVNTAGGTPYLALTLDTGGTVNAAYVSGSGTTALLFRYTVNTGDLDNDGITVAGTVSANGGTLQDAAGNNAIISFTAPETGAILIDTIAPTLNIASPSVAATSSGPVDFLITYTSADSISLAATDVTLNMTGTANGTVEVSGSGNGSRTITIAGITGSGTLSISIAADTASDLAGNSAAAAGPSESFTVNSAPTLNVDNATISIGEGSSATNTGMFSDAEGNATATVSTSAGFITVDNNAGTWNWIFNSADGPEDSQSITVQIEDGISTNSVTFTLNVTNVAPTAVAQSVVTPEDTATNITLAAIDPGADIITNWVITVGPTNGTLSGVAPDLVYTPSTNFNGLDSFQFIATDSDGAESAAATIDITVTAENDAPVAGADSIARPDRTRTAKITKSALLANDTDPDNDTLTISAVGNATPSGATVVMAGAFVVYTAPSTNAGDGSFSYILSDGAGGHNVTNIVPVIEVASVPGASGPNYSAITASGSDFILTFIGVPGHTYRVQYTTSLSAPYVWNEFSPLAIYTAPTNGVFTHLDVNPSEPMRLYRAVPHP